MRPARRLRILHLSDLHIGKEKIEDAWRVERVMGEAWTQNLREIAADGPIDLICFTGDLAQSGKGWEYLQIRRTIEHIVQSLKSSFDRFFCVPGNHDIDRDIAPDAWAMLRDAQWADAQGFSRWMAGGKPPFGWDASWRDAVLTRQQPYRDWLDVIGLGHLHPQHSPHGRLGYRRSLDLCLGAPLHIIGFDSAWLAGDNHDKGKLRLTEDQVGRLMTGPDGICLPGWSIGLIHHPLTDLADERDAQRLLGDYGLGLLLHGHQHDTNIETWSDPQRRLPSLAAGCLYEHHRYPNGLMVIDVELPEAQPLRPLQVWARKWSNRRADWINDDELYRGTRNGRLRLVPETPDPLRLTPGNFIGRNVELDLLRKALLPDDTAARKPTVVCCAVEGMPGVGKTRLAERFIAEHWLPAYPPPDGVDPAECVLRIVLKSGQDVSVDKAGPSLTVELLGQLLADRLRSTGPTETLWLRLRTALQEGPGGQPRLVLIENVDAEAQARIVAALVNHLSSCPILVTARYRQFAGADWAQVSVGLLPLAEAVELLREKTGRDNTVLNLVQAEQLAARLGRLPLALHIAASHLCAGLTPDEFLVALRTNGLQLRPANDGDYGLSVDEARAMLRSSFDLSWEAWRAGAGASLNWQQALIALANGPMGDVGESLGSAITDLLPVEYGPCIVAASRLSLLDIERVIVGGAGQRRIRLHPLMAEFLRGESGVQAVEVVERIGSWLSPRLWLREDDRFDVAWSELQSELDALLYWLEKSQSNVPWELIARSTFFASSFGPYSAWIKCYKRWLSASRDDEFKAAALFGIASISSISGAYQESIDAAVMAAEIFKKQGKEYEYAVAIGSVAHVMEIMGKYEESMEICLKKQLPALSGVNFEREYAATLHRIASLYLQLGFSARALKICRRDLIPIFTRLKQRRYLAMTFQLTADALFRRNRVNEAISLIEIDVIPAFKDINDARGLAVANGLLADFLQYVGKYDRSIEIRVKEFDVYKRIGDMHSMTTCRSHLAAALLRRGKQEDRQYARSLLQQAHHDAKELGLPEANAIRDAFVKFFGAS